MTGPLLVPYDCRQCRRSPRCQVRAPARPPSRRLMRFSGLGAHRALPCSACCCARARGPAGPRSVCPPRPARAARRPRSATARTAASAAAASPLAADRRRRCPPAPGWPPPSPPAPLLALRAAAGSSAKDRGGSPEKAATDLSGEHKLNKSQQLKKVFKECGAVGVSFHVGISSVSLGIFYPAASSGVDMTAVLFKPGFSESSLQSKRAAGTSTFLLAYAIHKLFAPV
ncbi:protein FAM210B, mitochondrial-like isoform X1 [Anser cygnoides]|uniref:protein FAM210B, mitochondrial-like isoform X1 n=1 Tax=Anser cygnoides TaxID=8845 RepID=UPI0034D1C948